MRFVKSKNEFDSLVSTSESLIRPSNIFPDKLFRKKYSLYLFITFDEIHMRVFFQHLRKYLKVMSEMKFVYLVLEPSPSEYVCDQIIKYKAIEFSVDDTEDEFIKALNEYSGGDEPDCVMDNSDQILIFSESKKWCVYSDREADLSVCAFSDQDCHRAFQVAYGNDLLPDVEAAAKYAYGDREEYYRFIRNYSVC